MSALFDRVLPLHDDDGNLVLLPRAVVADRELVMLGLPDGGTCLMERGELLRTHVNGSDGASSGPLTHDEVDEVVAGLSTEHDEELIVLRCPDGGYFVVTSAMVAATRLSDEDAEELREVSGPEVSLFGFDGAPAALVGVGTAPGLPGFEINRISVVGLPSRAFNRDNYVS